jgi:ABC-type transporter Mla subunit MlaD
MPVKATRIIRVIVIVLFAVAGSTLLYLLINNFQFSRGVNVMVHFTSVGDLNGGAWVRKAGLKVGSVSRLEPDVDEKTVIATLTFRPGAIVRTADKFSLVSKGILGDMYIEQTPGPKDSPLAESGHRFEGVPAFNLTDLLSGDTMNLVTDLASSIKGVVEILEKNQGVLESSLKDIAATAHNVRIVTDRAVEVTQSVPDMTRQITSAVAQLQATVTEVTETTKKVLANLEGNLTSSGNDLSVSMKAVRETTAQVQSAVAALTAQNALIARLSAPSTSQSLEATLKNLEEVSAGLLTVTRDTEKVVKGISTIFEEK